MNALSHSRKRSGMAAGMVLLLGSILFVAGDVSSYYSFPGSSSVPGTGLSSRYAVIDLGTNRIPTLINDQGTVVTYQSASQYSLWKSGTSTNMPTNFIPCDLNTNDVVSGIESGTVVGSSPSYTSPAATWTPAGGLTTLSAQSFPSPVNFTLTGSTNSVSLVLLSMNTGGGALLDDSGNVYWYQGARYRIYYNGFNYTDNGFGNVFGGSSGHISDVVVAAGQRGEVPNFIYNSGGTYLQATEANGQGVFIGSYSDNASENMTLISGTFGSGSMYYNGGINRLSTNLAPASINSTGEILARDSSASSLTSLNSSFTVPSTASPTWSSVNDIFWNSSHQITGNGYLFDPANGTQPAIVNKLNDLLMSSSGWSNVGTHGSGSGQKKINNLGAIIGTALNVSDSTSHGVMLVPSELAVDVDRNGTIVLANENPSGADATGNSVDQTTQARPFRYWINGDQDNGTANSSGSDVVAWNPTTAVPSPDCNSDTIVSVRDLEDWTRLWIYTKGLNTAIKNGDILVGLKWKNVTGTPGIKIVQATDSDGGLEYLNDTTGAAATAQATFSGSHRLVLLDDNDSHSNIVPSGNAADFVFPVDTWGSLSDTAPKTYFLFEGTSRGEGQLEIVFLKNDGTTKIGEGGNLWLDLRDIKEMYLRALVNGNNPPPQPYTFTTGTVPDPALKYAIDNSNVGGTSGTFVADPNENTSSPTYIVFVHGFNQSYAGSTNFGETMFKRLWQRGYRGRFASFRWPTYGTGWSIGPATLSGVGIFNDCEYIAWSSGAALKQFVSDKMSGYNVDLAVHSLGNVVASEAIREGMTVNHYALLHAAVPAICYNNATSSYSVSSGSVPDNDSDSYTRGLGYSAYNSTGHYYQGWLGGIDTSSPAGGIVNFGSANDIVITAIWNANDIFFKPQPLSLGYAGNYVYAPSGTSTQKLYLLTGSTGPVYRYMTNSAEGLAEAKAYVDYSLSGTVGRQTTAAGSIHTDIPEAAFDTHSYEWEQPLQNTNVYSFYSTLMGSSVFDLHPIP